MSQEKIKFRYPNVSAGYAGARVPNSTLSSRFFGLLLSGCLDLEKPLLFPQRIPKLDFFEELASLEGPDFQRLFSTNIAALRSDLENPLKCVNAAKALLRLGEVEALRALKFDKAVRPFVANLQLQFIRESALINEALSDGKEFSLSGYKELIIVAISNFTALQLIPVLAHYVALSFRFFKDKAVHSTAQLKCDVLEGFLLEKPQTFEAKIAHSIASRALAMNYFNGRKYQQAKLDRMVELIEAATPTTEAESIAFLDNKLTSHQTLSKWHSYQKDSDHAEHCVRSMIEIDPLDSTGFSELGFYLSARGRDEEALAAFKRAADLGPPAVGMNHFFCGKSFVKLGNLESAAGAFEEAINTDPLAISPHLELLRIYREKGNLSKRAEISGRIISNSDLSGQLESKEYDEVLSESKIRAAI